MPKRWLGARILATAIVASAVVVATAWSVGALYYSPLPAPATFAAAFGVGTVLAFALLPWRRALPVFCVVFAVLTVWWLRIPASNARR